mgnify:CR=1 FL=1
MPSTVSMVGSHPWPVEPGAYRTGSKKERLDGKSTENRAVPGSALQSFLHFWISAFIKFRFRKDHKRVFTTSLRATAMRTAIRYSTAAIPMSSMYGAFTSAREIRSRKWTPYSHPCTSKESTFRTSTVERRRMLTQHFRQKSKRQTMHSASAHGNWQNAFRIPQRIWLQQKSS